MLRDAVPAKAAQSQARDRVLASARRNSPTLASRLKAAGDKLDKDAPTLAEAERNRRQRELVDQDRELQRKRREFQEDLSQRKNEELAVRRRARQPRHQADLRDREVRPHPAGGGLREPEVDITDKVIKALNAQGRAASDRGLALPLRLADVASMHVDGRIVEQLGGELIGDAGHRASRGIGPLEGAAPVDDRLPRQPALPPQLAGCAAACVIVAPALRDAAAARGAAIVAADPYLYFARLTQWWAARTRPPPSAGVHPSGGRRRRRAAVAPTRRSAPSPSSRPARVDRRRRGHRRALLRRRRRRGSAPARASRRASRSAPAAASARAASCTAARSSAPTASASRRPTGAGRRSSSSARCVIGDDVEIGANTCIDRGALGDTVIGDGVKLDNLVQIGHNVRIGAHTAIAGCVGIAGSAVIGAHCMIGGAASIVGHIDDRRPRAHLGAASVVTRSITQAGRLQRRVSLRRQCRLGEERRHLRHLHALRDRVRALEKKSDRHDDDGHPRDPASRLPHRYPFLLVDRVLELEHGKRIKALKNVTINEPYFVGHFPHRPVMPGVMMLEALAQARRCCRSTRRCRARRQARSTTSPASTARASSGRSSRATS